MLAPELLISMARMVRYGINEEARCCIGKARINRYRIAICDAIFAVCDVTLIFCRKFCDAVFPCKYAIAGYRIGLICDSRLPNAK